MNRRLTRGSIVVAVLSTCAIQAANATLITFDTGYTTTGTSTAVTGAANVAMIQGQGATATKWVDNSTNPNFVVVSGAGNGGGVGLVSATSQQANASATYAPTLSELGATAFSLGSKQHFSLDLQLLNDGNLSSSTELYRLGVGLATSSQYPLELQVMGAGAVRVRSDGLTKLTLSNALTEGGSFRTFSGDIDYATSTVTVLLDGVSQGSYSFAGTYDRYGQFKFNVRRTDSAIGIALDNLSVTVPEPAAASLVGLGALGLLVRRRASAVRR